MGRIYKETIGEREREVLRAVVENNIGNPAPVGSRTLSRNLLGELHLSPATIRNIMADLDAMGYIEKPHSSAGSIPTDTGYRFYVEELLTARTLPARQRKMIDECLERGKEGPEDMLSVVSRLLAGLSHQAGVVLFPKISSDIIEKSYFIRVSASQIQVVLVTSTGRVQNIMVDVGEDFKEIELVEIANLINRDYSRRTLRQIRNALLHDISEGEVSVSRLRARALAINEKLVSRQSLSEILVGGTAMLLDVPEFRNDSETLKEMFKLLSDKKRILAILDKCLDGRRVAVEMGAGPDDSGVDGCAIVAHACGRDDLWGGAIGVIGSRRMDYPYLLGLLDYFSTSLGNMMEEGR